MRITTTDLYESSFLHCSGMKLVEIWLDRGKLHTTAVFAFEGNYQLEELQKSYHTGNAMVNLTDFRRSLNQLRTTMYKLLNNKNQKSRTVRRSEATTGQGRKNHHDPRRNQTVH